MIPLKVGLTAMITGRGFISGIKKKIKYFGEIEEHEIHVREAVTIIYLSEMFFLLVRFFAFSKPSDIFCISS